MDSTGCFGRTLADAVRGLNAIVGVDQRDPFTRLEGRIGHDDYSLFLSSKLALKGAKFGLPGKRCWDLVPEDRRVVARQIFDAIQEAGGEVIPVDFPCAEERISPDGSWNW